jgi:hypothetical protein
MNTKERLRKFVEYKGFGRNRFEELVGISLGYISTKSPSVGSEIIEKIANVFHDLNVEWLVTGKGKMINPPYFQEIGTAESPNYKKLIYAPLISRHAQTEYINRMNEKSYIDTLPTLPVVAEYESKGSYICFEMRDDSMNDGTDNSYNTGDILICRETDFTNRQKKLYSNKPKSFVIVHAHEGITVRQIISHDVEKDIVTVHSPNSMYEDRRMHLQDVKKLFIILELQRTVN